MARLFRRGMFNRVGLTVGEPLVPALVQPEVLRQRLAQLLASDTAGSAPAL